MTKHIYTFVDNDVGKITIRLPKCTKCGQSRRINLSGIIGRVQRQDVGKRVYDSDGIIQVENLTQLIERQARKKTNG